MSSACVGRFVSPDKMGITASKEEPRDHRSREGLAIGPQESQSSQGIDITASGIITMYNISLHNISHLCDTQHCDTQQNCVDVMLIKYGRIKCAYVGKSGECTRVFLIRTLSSGRSGQVRPTAHGRELQLPGAGAGQRPPIWPAAHAKAPAKGQGAHPL